MPWATRYDRGPAPIGARAAVQLICAATAIAVLVLVWFDGLLAGPIEGREVPVVRVESSSVATPLAVSVAAEVAARERGLLVLRRSPSEPMPAILGECRLDTGEDGGPARLVGLVGASPLVCRLPAVQRSWRQRLAALVATAILVLAAAALLLAGVGLVPLSVPVTAGLALAVTLTVAVRIVDPSADLVWLWVAVAVAGSALAVAAAVRVERRRGGETAGRPHAGGASSADGEATPSLGLPPKAPTGAPGGGGERGDAETRGVATGPAVPREGRRDSIRIAPRPETDRELAERPGGLTPPTIGLPSRTARRGAIAATEHPAFPDTVVDWGRIGDLELRAASARGASHRVDGRPRQDAFAIGRPPGGRFAVVAVADGIGSSDTSQFGAAAAVRHGVAAVGRRLAATPDLRSLEERDVMEEIAAEMVASTSSEIGPNGREIGERIATTLVLAAAELDPGRRRAAWCARTGDSDARLLTRDGWHRIFPAEERGQIATSATATLPLAPDAAEARLIGWDDGAALAVLSDGLAKPLGSGGGAVGRFLGRAWAQPPDPLEFAIQVQFRRRTFDDDRTAIVLWPRRSSSGWRG